MLEYIQQNPYEVGGFVTSLICVWLNARENVWGWAWAIGSALLSAKFYYDQRLFGDMYLQFFFVGSAFYGIYNWRYGGRQATVLKISSTPFSEWVILLFGGTVCFFLLVYALAKLKGDAIYLDALTTTLSLVGQLMMARKLIENWGIWILANILYVYLFWQKGAYLYTSLYFIFIILAIYGLFRWIALSKKIAQSIK